MSHSLPDKLEDSKLHNCTFARFYKEIQGIHAKKYLPKNSGVQDGQEKLTKHVEPI
jgi:hypothetical protein